MPSPIWEGLIQSNEGLNRTQRWRKGESILSGGDEASIFSCMQTWVPLFFKLLGSDWGLKFGPHQAQGSIGIRTKPAYTGKLAMVKKLNVKILLPVLVTAFSFIQVFT